MPPFLLPSLPNLGVCGLVGKWRIICILYLCFIDSGEEEWRIICILYLCFIDSGEEAGTAVDCQCRRRLRFPYRISQSPGELLLCVCVSVCLSVSLCLSVCLSLPFPPSLSVISGHRRPMWDSEKVCLTSPPCPYLFTIHFLGPSSRFLSLSVTFPGIEERTADPKRQRAD